MAARFAGDLFDIPLSQKTEDESVLAQYFPEIRTIKRRAAAPTGEKEQEPDGARSFGGQKATRAFGGFKTFLG